jgi:hypothetical protein
MGHITPQVVFLTVTEGTKLHLSPARRYLDSAQCHNRWTGCYFLEHGTSTVFAILAEHVACASRGPPVDDECGSGLMQSNMEVLAYVTSHMGCS